MLKDLEREIKYILNEYENEAYACGQATSIGPDQDAFLARIMMLIKETIEEGTG